MEQNAKQIWQRKWSPFLELEAEGRGQKQAARIVAQLGRLPLFSEGMADMLVIGSGNPAYVGRKRTKKLWIVAAKTDGIPVRTECDEVIHVSDQDAAQSGSRLARAEGILVGFSSGAAVWAASELAKRPKNRDKTILVWLPDAGKQYLSAPF